MHLNSGPVVHKRTKDNRVTWGYYTLVMSLLQCEFLVANLIHIINTVKNEM
jgi:hypothetical protein